MGPLLAPPYDVISPEQQEQLYQRHPNNVVRLILGKILGDDNEQNSRYTRAAADLRSWMKEGVLKPYPAPALYLYTQAYEMDGKTLTRLGFVCGLKAEAYGEGKVFPHERTLSGPKTDRLNLTRACRMNFSQVFGLYSDPNRTLDDMFEKVIGSQKPAVEAEQDGVLHRMWPISDPKMVQSVVSFMADMDVVIADGHHRYETAVNYRKERRAQEGGADGDYDYVLMFLSNTHGQGFTVLPTHRFVLKTDLSAEQVVDALARDFSITPIKVNAAGADQFMRELKDAGQKSVSFGLYLGDGDMRLISLKEDAPLPTPPGSERLPALSHLDVTILQELILGKAMGISREMVEAGGHIYYTKSATEALEKVDTGGARMAFLMNPTEIEQVMQIARGGVTMPQKSTYFYPKLISGLVFNPL